MTAPAYRRAVVPWLETHQGDVYACPLGAAAPLRLSDGAALLWELCEAPTTLAAMLDVLAEPSAASREDMAPHVAARLSELTDAGVLVEVSEASPAPEAPSAAPSGRGAEPTR